MARRKPIAKDTQAVTQKVMEIIEPLLFFKIVLQIQRAIMEGTDTSILLFWPEDIDKKYLNCKNALLIGWEFTMESQDLSYYCIAAIVPVTTSSPINQLTSKLAKFHATSSSGYGSVSWQSPQILGRFQAETHFDAIYPLSIAFDTVNQIPYTASSVEKNQIFLEFS